MRNRIFLYLFIMMFLTGSIGALMTTTPSTALVRITSDLKAQTEIIEEYMLQYIDGVECWHSRHDARTTTHYIEFAKKHNLLMTGGSDCHQKPIIMGTLDIPDWVAGQFN